MTKEIISQNPYNINPEIIEVIHFSSGFCRMPDAIFKIPDELGIGRWKARFIVGLSYLYALSFGKEKATCTQRELQSIMETSSFDTVNLFIKEVNGLFEKVKLEAESGGVILEGGEIATQRGRNGRTQAYLIDQTLLAESFRHVAPHGGTFAFHNISLLLPLSAQAKAVLLYLNRKARGGSLLDGKAEAEVSVRELAKVLAIGTGGGRLKGYLAELEEAGVVERISGKKLKFRICKISEWNRETLLNMLHNWKGHSFLKNWKFPVEPVDPQKFSGRATTGNSPIRRQKISDTATYTTGNSPIRRQKISDTATHRNKYRNKSNKERNKSEEYDAIYNGGGVSKAEKENGTTKEGRKEIEKVKEAKLGNSNIEDRLNKEELGKIKKRLASVAADVERLAARSGITRRQLQDLYGALRKIYGEYWWVLAAMYELFHRKPGYGYGRGVNANYLGLLISFALKDSPASFWEFCDRFVSVFGLERKESSDTSPAVHRGTPGGRTLLDRVRDALRRELPPALYKTFVENGIVDVYAEGGRAVVVCRDKIIAEYLTRNCGGVLSGEFGRIDFQVADGINLSFS